MEERAVKKKPLTEKLIKRLHTLMEKGPKSRGRRFEKLRPGPAGR
jgi:hypothetical protein